MSQELYCYYSTGFYFKFYLRTRKVIGPFEKRAPGLKTGVENDRFFGLKHGQDLENQAAHPHQEFPAVVPRAPMLPDRQWSATQLTSKSDYFIWRKVKWKGKIFAVSVEINSDKDQKGRVKTGKRFRKREIKIRLLGKLLSTLFLLSNVSVHLRFCSVSVIVSHT